MDTLLISDPVEDIEKLNILVEILLRETRQGLSEVILREIVG